MPLLVHNFSNFPEHWSGAYGAEGHSVRATSVAEYLKWVDDPDAIFIVNCDPVLTLELARAQLLRFNRRPLVAVDLVLRRPHSASAKASALLKRFLFRRVDFFLHYFRDLQALDECYGIGPARSGFIPFKANLWELRAERPNPAGEYVLCFGRSLRDFDTFFTAMEQLPYPGAIVDPQVAKVWDHGSRFTRSMQALPKNIRVLEHDLSNASQAQVLAGAKIVVLPILKEAIVSAGISTALNAMALGKCVIASAGPGVTDIFEKELLAVPPEDAAALRAKIQAAWEDETLRFGTARAAHEYALRCGGEHELYQRVIDGIMEWRAAIPTERSAA